MEDPVGPGRVRLKLYGRRGYAGRDVPLSGAVFARKILTLIRALTEADKAINGRRRYEYAVHRLADGSGMIEMEERRIKPVLSASSTEAFNLCIEAVNGGHRESAKRWGRCAEFIEKLAKGADSSFGYGELWVDRQPSPFRLDQFLEEQSSEVVDALQAQTLTSARTWFKGAVNGSFVGHLLEVDFRGALPQGKLILSAGGKELDCVFRDEDIEAIRSNARRRVRVEGIARYDGKSGLPRRIEVRTIKATRERAAVDFTKWKGSFSPFRTHDWTVS